MLLTYTIGVWFIYRLLLSLGAKVIRKYNIDTKDLDTVSYATIYIYIEKSTTSKRAIQRMYIERAPNSN